MSIASQAGSTGTLNIGAAAGQAAVAPGTLNTASVDFGDGTGQIVFNHTATNYVFAPVIIGSGSGTGAVRVEAGTTILTATSTYTGPTVVNGGLLMVDGTAAAVTVNPGGTLAGNGIVGNTTINGGVLSPGNSIGLLTVQGNLVFTAAASYLVEVSPSNADRTNVTGTATLGGATVNASFAAGNLCRRGNIPFSTPPAASAAPSGPGQHQSAGEFQPSLSYDANNAYLNLALNFIAAPGGGLNSNQQNVGNAIVNFFNTNGSIPLVFGGADPGGPDAGLRRSRTGSQQTTFDAMKLFMGLLTDPFIAGRGDPFEAGRLCRWAPRPTPRGKPRSEQRDAYAAIYRKAPVAPIRSTQRWSVWAAGYGGSQTTDGNAALGSNNTTSRIYGGVVGPTIGFRRSRSQALRSPAAELTLALRTVLAPAAPICFRPAPSSGTPSVQPTSPQHSPMAGRTSPPIAP